METQYVTVSQLMKEFNLSRNTVINWIKSKENNVRFYQEGKVIRVDHKDFKEMIERKIEASLDAKNENS